MASIKVSGVYFTKEAARAKLYCSELANEATKKCMQIYGDYGYTSEYPLEKMDRDAKVTEIYEGTSEAQKMVISKLMGLN